jgi:hypothetical protein
VKEVKSIYLYSKLTSEAVNWKGFGSSGFSLTEILSLQNLGENE